ncbi:MAG TPA: protein phosphatase 2C domain-containing protein [Pseudonocardiaceae bacterium]
MSLVLSSTARTDRGLVRSNNEDVLYAGQRLLAVADGMGGHVAGEIAATLVIAALTPLDDNPPPGDLLRALYVAVQAGNTAIRDSIEEHPKLAGMGTTLTAMLFAGDRIGVANIGDSRTYRLRDGVAAPLTHDDSLVQFFIDAGRITPEEARNHRQRAVLLRALTGKDEEPTLSLHETRIGDRFLLCSDGLSDVVDDDTIGETLRIPHPHACADQLIKLALHGGGPDNVTVIVADVEEAKALADEPALQT